MNYRIFQLKDVCTRLNSGKNIKSEKIMKKGNYPVFGGNGARGYTDIYNFDGECAIIGRQGAFCGNVRYFSGKAYMTEHAVVVCANEMNNTHYLAYLLSMMNLGRLSGQSAQPGLSVKTLGNQEIKLPKLEYQNKVVKIISSLEEKIENNKKINDNLEKQAKTIFEKCFPDINNGSDIIGKVIVPKRGKTLLSKNALLGDIPVIAGGIEPTIYHNIANTISPVITISASGANAGYVNLWNRPVWSSDSSFIDSSMTKNVYFWYILLKNKQKEIFESQTGSAQPHIYPKHIAELKVNIPSKKSIQEFSLIITPFFEHISKNLFENDKLSNIRNAILPKLISGNIDISNI